MNAEAFRGRVSVFYCSVLFVMILRSVVKDFNVI